SPVFFLGPARLALVDGICVRTFVLAASSGHRGPEIRLPAERRIWSALGSVDGTRLYLANERRLHCLDVSSGEWLWATFALPANGVTALSISPCGQLVLAGSAAGHVRLLSGSTGKKLADLSKGEVPYVGVGAVAVASSGAAAWCAASNLR